MRTLIVEPWAKPSLVWFSILLFIVPGFSQETAVGDDLRVTEITSLSDTLLEITFEETGDGFAEFKFETSVDLSGSASVWSLLDSVILEPAGEHRYRATILVVQGENRFFRITGEGSSNDTDGDGVSNLEEEINGTNPLLADSDEDGFSDSVEIAAGTDPNKKDEKPDYSFLPAVRFTLRNATIEEDNYTHSIHLESDKPVFGKIGYTISVLSNATTEGVGHDVTLISNTVDFAGGTTAAIQISIRDDGEVEDMETLVFDLAGATDGNYRVGAVDQHLLLIKDNDAFWTGTIIGNGSETSFRMLMIEEGNLSTGKLVSTIENGSGVIPEGEYNLTINKTSTSFEAWTEPISMNSSLLFEAELKRMLFISVAPPDNPEDPFAAYFFRPDRMVGTILDELTTVDENLSYLNQESLNPVILIRDVPQYSNLEIPSEEAQ